MISLSSNPTHSSSNNSNNLYHNRNKINISSIKLISFMMNAMNIP